MKTMNKLAIAALLAGLLFGAAPLQAARALPAPGAPPAR